MSSTHHARIDDLVYAALSDVGMKRAMNQDAWKVLLADDEGFSERGHCFIVADGMGAHAAGELASKMAVDEVSSLTEAPPDEVATPHEMMLHALREANFAIHTRGQAERQLFNMGTTCSSLLLRPEGALVAHVGDSRIYRCRDQRIDQLTFDHSLVWEMRAAGQRDSDSSSTIPRNVITRCLGPQLEVDVDLEGFFSVRPNDRFLLCSDGLTGRISDAEIGAITCQLDPEESVQFLVDLANLRGGSDNITVVVAQVVGERLRAEGEVDDHPAGNDGGGTHPAWWFATSAGIAMALLCYLSQRPQLAIAGIVLSVLAAFGAVWQWFRNTGSSNASPMPDLSPPYATANADFDQKIVSGLCETLEFAIDALQAKHPDIIPLREDIQEIRGVVRRDAVDDEGAALSSGDKLGLCKKLANLSRQLRERL